MMGRWKDEPPPGRAWKRRAGTSPAREQDKAAGGRDRRLIDIGDGRQAHASVALRMYPNARRIRAFLRWYQDGKSPERYLGEVEHDTRADNLTEAWKRAHARGLLIEDMPPGSWASSTATRAIMRGNRGKNTKPELALRSQLHQRGLRYRVDAPPMTGIRRRADVVFPKQRIAVFVDGCFWHGCPEHYRPATKLNPEFWEKKYQENKARDTNTNETLTSAGWTVIRIWEHEDMSKAAERIEAIVRELRDQST